MQCRRCGVVAPEGTGEAVYDQPGWKEGLCPSCRADRNARARARFGALAAEFTKAYAATRGWKGIRTATIRELPEGNVRSAFATGGGETDPDMQAVWAELGPGFYLLTMEGEGARADAVVNVDATGSVDVEAIAEADIADVIVLARQLQTEQPLLN